MSATICHANEDFDRFVFSGFSRLVAGAIDDDNASFDGYENSISFSQGSLFAFQLEANVTDSFFVTSQLLSHSSDSRDSGIEWLYLTYLPSKSVRLKAGRMRTPFFNYSDVLDVGFAYSWISPPPQVYNSYLFDYYDGASASYDFSTENYGIELETYIGSFDDMVSVGDTTGYRANTDIFKGLLVLIKGDKLQLRLSYHSGFTEIPLDAIDQFADILRAANFTKSAESLVTTGDVNVKQISLSYDEFDYFFKAEWIGIDTAIVVVPKVSSYYLTTGYSVYPYTFHITYAKNHSEPHEMVSEIPSGMSPQIDVLSAQYSMIYDQLKDDSMKSISVGVRWDFRMSMALKFDLTHLRGYEGKRSFFSISNPEEFDRKVNLVQVAWEWVF